MGNNLERLSGEGSPTQGSSSPTRRAAAALTSPWRNASSPDTPTRGSPAARRSDVASSSSPLYASTSLAPPSPSMMAAAASSPSGRGRFKHHGQTEGGGDSNPGSPSPSPPRSFDASLFRKPTRPAAASSSSSSGPRSREGSVTVMEPFPIDTPTTTQQGSGSPSSSFHAQSAVGALPAKVLARIFSSLSSADLLRCSLVSKEWLVLASMDAWWEELAMKDLETSGLVSAMLHERTELPHLTHGSWRALYWKYRRKEELTLRPRVVAVYDYRARTDRELDVKRGEVLRLLAEDSQTCWWLVQRTEKTVTDPSSQPATERAESEEAEEPKDKNEEGEREEQRRDEEGTTKEGEENCRDVQSVERQEEREEGQAGGPDERIEDAEEQTLANDVDEEHIANAVTATTEQGPENDRRVNELKGRKSAATVGWVPSGYLEHFPRRINPARALRSAAASAADSDVQDGRLPERNKKVPFMVRANFDYVGANAQELSFKKYDLMAVDLHPKEKYPVPFDTDDDSDDENDAQAPSTEGTDGKSIGLKAGWWKASLTRRSTTGGTTTVSGWIPVNLVTEEVTHVIALFDYMPASDEELPLKKGQRVAVLATDENRKGWIYAQGNGRRGWLPENYVVDDDDA